MTVDCPSPVNTSTSRVRRHRERLRNGLRLLTVTVPETVIENAIARRLLAAEDRAEPWPVIQGCYAAQLSDSALNWLIKGGGNHARAARRRRGNHPRHQHVARALNCLKTSNALRLRSKERVPS
jgi:hypothetical protein